ncbi:two-component system, OmpR family, phosphate regulon sensor histidine kinase PhoR [Chitinophaga jiangningensis]|uniref:histidine kinase n=1 Tax=Chitinophaga jiangningensis TaxID=1419482 RepID=A0A1M6WC24_9BACT|nr:HAMP domain-containing sensor histidine kinase [Chitinophaga jiangningensis]SHK91312.1 two-component system, OmpR family, phosphate regulon sensor histidine kinase PhoR [Chitinophaga jiangningensis]
MIPLKRIFPVIVALITISLFGIIYIQVNWIKSAVVIKSKQLDQRAIDVLYDIRQYFINHRGNYVQLRINPSADPTNNSLNLDFAKPQVFKPAVTDLFTPTEIDKVIKNSLREHRMDTAHYEFGINGPIPGFHSAWRVQSGGFAQLFAKATKDTLKKEFKIRIIPLDDNPTAASEQLFLITPNEDDVVRQLTIMIIGGVIFTLILITAFALTIRTMLNQKKLSEIKSDFINNMTHELKTPLATISLAIDAIGNEKVMDNKDKIRYFSGIIKEENKRMNKQVETILQSALLEKDEIGLKLQATDVHDVIQHTVDNLQLQLASKNGVVDLQLNAVNPVIMADDVHFSNVVFNLLDNAIKYSKENLEVSINTYNTRKSLFIIISDNGIGMSRDTISRIFEKFYRAHTGNVHNVKGFGLGLSYVKAIVDAHHGKIKVESVIGKGSKFTLEFPQE